MNAIAAARSDLTRWAASAVVVLGLHALGAATLLAWHDPIGMSDESSAIVVDLTPYAPSSESTDDVAPGPVQQAAAAPLEKVEPASEPKPEEKLDEKVEPKVELKPEEKVDVPPAPIPPVAAVPPPEAVEPPLPPVTPPEPESQPSQMPPAPATTAPPRPHSASAAAANAWHKGIFAQIQRHKAYPAAARARRENGVVQLAFSIDRDGRVVSSRVAGASGVAALDQAALETIQKAQPFPPPPADMAGDVFSFTVPVAFSIR
jgi:periplasmic protein TonB